VIAMLIFGAGVVLGTWLGWRRGWNAAVNHYRDRVIEGATAQAERARM
jgi:hypothetical protein